MPRIVITIGADKRSGYYDIEKIEHPHINRKALADLLYEATCKLIGAACMQEKARMEPGDAIYTVKVTK